MFIVYDSISIQTRHIILCVSVFETLIVYMETISVSEFLKLVRP